MWNKYATGGEVNKRLRHLQLICLQLLITKLRFTACNLFDLDWTFCHTVAFISKDVMCVVIFNLQLIAAIATYVVILIQFNI
jgi:hypothetical protein